MQRFRKRFRLLAIRYFVLRKGLKAHDIEGAPISVVTVARIAYNENHDRA
jgi:hypothetical protein